MRIKPKLVYKLISNCCGALLHAGLTSPIDTAPTLICGKCHIRDKEAEKKYDNLDCEGQSGVEQHFIWH